MLRMRVLNALVRDLRQRISSMRRSSLISTTLLPGMFTVTDATLRLPLTEYGARFATDILFGERFNNNDHDVK